MPVYVKAKRMAVSGLLAACTVLLIVLGTVLEMSTLFCLCAAAYCVGTAVREWGVRYGAAFLAACTLLALIVSPNKMYCLTFAAMGLYLWLSEILWRGIAKSVKITHKTEMLWCGKYVIFNLLYIPALIFVPRLFITKKITGILWVFMLAAGQIGILIFDKAHTYFQIFVWNRLRKYVIK